MVSVAPATKNVKTMLSRLDGLDTSYICGDCRQILFRSNNFDKREVQGLVTNLTGSCPNCRHLLSFSPANINFLLLSATA